MSVDADSTIDLSSAFHFTELPNLTYFVNSGFPFTRMADLSDTAVVLSSQPSPTEISAFLNLMGELGSWTFQPVNRVTVMRTSDVSEPPDKDLIVIGTLTQLTTAAGFLSRSPYRLDGNGLHVELPGILQGIWRLFGDTAAQESQKAAAALTAPLGEGSAAMIAAASPAGHGRSILAILGGSPQSLRAIVAAMRDSQLVPNIQGDFALLAGGTIASYRAGPMYTVGELPLWLWPEWWLRDQPVMIILVMIAAAVAICACLYRILRWLAGRRVARLRASQG